MVLAASMAAEGSTDRVDSTGAEVGFMVAAGPTVVAEDTAVVDVAKVQMLR